MPLIETKGAASAQGFGEFATSSEKLYIESCFSTWLYTGNGSTQTITNGIDLSTKGGLVWVKKRNSATDGNHILFDTARGQPWLSTNTTSAQLGSTGYINYNSDGFGWTFGSASWNYSGDTFASWTFRKQAKFFDVVTWTGDGTVPRSIAHNLGSVPGFIAIKLTSGADNWICRHRSAGDTPNDMTNYTTNSRLFLNLTNAASGSSNIKADASTFTVNHVGDLNTSGATYVAYIFAHNAGGFGLSGSDNVISCGSYTTDGSGNATVNLGYEPQWVLHKRSDSTDNWLMHDNMRGLNETSVVSLFPNLSNAESTFSPAWIRPTATGLQFTNRSANATYIYIAIRRGPMKVPTSGTSVFDDVTYTGNGTSNQLVGSLLVDASFSASRSLTNPYNAVFTRLLGNKELATSGTSPEYTSEVAFDQQAGLRFTGTTYTATNNNSIQWQFRRAPGFMDVVCYTGDGTSVKAYNHNLGVAPELIILKSRSSTTNIQNYWFVAGNIGASSYINLYLQQTAAGSSLSYSSSNIFSGSPTATTFTVGGTGNATYTNGSGVTYVAYLFATVAGVSKVFSFTGNGSSQTINCGFTGGARFVMIKRIDSTGDWYVWDSARGIVASNDPHLSLNTTAAEVTTDDSVDADSTGFVVNQNSATNVNVNGATYIGLAVA